MRPVPNVMDRCWTRWLLPIFLVALSSCSVIPGSPSAPSVPQCHIPYDEYDWTILCVWEPGGDSHVSTTYTLHWESANTKEQVEGTRVNGSIPRDHIPSHAKLSVWVQAVNQHGSATSERATFNTADIMEPSTPSVADHSVEPLEIYWPSGWCSTQGHGDCEVRHRTQGNRAWSQVEGRFLGSYMMEHPQPCTIYEFQIRCNCPGSGGLMSDWSLVYKVESAKAAPVGELDVWRDCSIISSTNSECVLMWKKLPKAKACGHILGYEVTLSRGNGAVTVVNVSAAEAGGQPACDGVRCHLAASLAGVSVVKVAAYGEHGATTPAPLTMTVTGTQSEQLAVHLKMDEESIRVFWDLPPQSTESLKEYVVQYKQAGLPPTLGFDWIRVNKRQKSAIIRGQFKNCTAYQVSLFAVFQSSSNQQLSSIIGYASQGIPPRVSSFKAVSIHMTHVSLSWVHIPLSQRNGVILCYQIGVSGHEVYYNVTGYSHRDNRTFLMQHLHPGEEYEVWIRAMTEAGPGPNATARFKTTDHHDYGYTVPVIIGTVTMAVACIMCTVLSVIRVKKKNCPLALQCCHEKVPDPGNSLIFRQMRHQFNGSLAWICVPIPEPSPKLSQVEVVEKQPQAHETCSQKTPWLSIGPTEGVVAEQGRQANRGRGEEAVGEQERAEGRRDCSREAYSKMIDSDEEQDGEEGRGDSSSLSEEDMFLSDYEKHFMPTHLDA